MKVLLLEDHNFFGDEIAEYLRDEMKADVSYAHTYDEAALMIEQRGPFDFSFLDIILQNGKTGIDIVNNYEQRLGKIMFITGCIDQATLERIKDYSSASKLYEIWPKLKAFVDGQIVNIN